MKLLPSRNGVRDFPYPRSSSSARHPRTSPPSQLQIGCSCVNAPWTPYTHSVTGEKRSRILESLTGEGLIYEGNTLIARARFSLTVTRERQGSGLPWGQPSPARLTDIRGVITIISGQRRLVDGSTLLLQLIDGRHWEFIVQSGNYISGEYVAIGTGRQNITS